MESQSNTAFCEQLAKGRCEAEIYFKNNLRLLDRTINR